MVYIIQCGKRKRDIPSRACDLYVGSYFKKNLEYVRAYMKENDTLLILSAKYGLLQENEIIEPYELKANKMGDFTGEFWESLKYYEFLRESNIIVTVSKLYFKALREFLPNARLLPELDKPNMSMGRRSSVLTEKIREVENARKSKKS